MNRKTLLTLLCGLAILGILLSLYLVKHHYDKEEGFCDVNSMFSCSTVNRSDYATFFHIPVATFGVLWFLVLLGFSIQSLQKKGERRILFWSILGILSVLYFVYAEVQLKAICLWCTSVHFLVLFSFLLAILLYRKKSHLP